MRAIGTRHTQRMYLHSVTTKENLLKSGQSGADAEASERSGTVTTGGTPTVLRDTPAFNVGYKFFAACNLSETLEFLNDADATDVETARAIFASALADQTESGAGDEASTALKGRLAKWFAGVNGAYDAGTSQNQPPRHRRSPCRGQPELKLKNRPLDLRPNRASCLEKCLNQSASIL